MSGGSDFCYEYHDVMAFMFKHYCALTEHCGPRRFKLHLVGHTSRVLFFFSSRRRHTRFKCDWSSDVCSSDLICSKLTPLNSRISLTNLSHPKRMSKPVPRKQLPRYRSPLGTGLPAAAVIINRDRKSVV